MYQTGEKLFPTKYINFLPPANEVWCKVMFSEAFVCPQGSFCMMSLLSRCLVPSSFQEVSVSGPMFLLRVSVSGPMFLPEGVSVSGPSGGLFPGGGPPWTETPIPRQRAPGQRPYLDKDPSG